MIDALRGTLAQFKGQVLRRIIYYRPQCDANIHLNYPHAHDVGQGMEFAFDIGHFFITWDTSNEEELNIQKGRMVDWLSGGLFEDASELDVWQPHIGKPLISLDFLPSYTKLQFDAGEVYIVTAEIDRQYPETIDGMADNLVVFFSEERLQAFLAQYGLT